MFLVAVSADSERNVSCILQDAVLYRVWECEADLATWIHAERGTECGHDVRVPRHDEHTVCIIGME